MGDIPLITALSGMFPSYVRIVLGIWLLTAPLVLRENARVRVPIVLTGLFAVYALLSAAFMFPSAEHFGLAFSLGQFATYSLLLVACVGACLLIYDTNVWTALFCCSAGYTVQNLQSGLVELVWSLMGGGSPLSGSYASVERYALDTVCTLVLYIAFYFLVTRHLRRSGLENIEDRSMLIMMAVTILVIIGFDLVIKWLVERGIETGAMVLLRCFHGLACIFTLTMEFQLLITRRVQAERDTLEKVVSEQERQYEQARENVSAINARVHDIRHAIGRLASDGGVERDVIRDLVREIDVYDTKVKTGNEALDIVLSERRLQLERQGVTLTCMADGAALGFMAPADVYTLVGSLIDAAVCSDGKALSLVVSEQMGAPVVSLTCQGTEPDETLLREARTVARRFGGTLASRLEDGTLRMNVLFPA